MSSDSKMLNNEPQMTFCLLDDFDAASQLEWQLRRQLGSFCPGFGQGFLTGQPGLLGRLRRGLGCCLSGSLLALVLAKAQGLERLIAGAEALATRRAVVLQSTNTALSAVCGRFVGGYIELNLGALLGDGSSL